MPEYDTRRTPDYSPLLVHFTKGARPNMDHAADHPLHGQRDATAKDRLINILRTRTVYASRMPFLPNNPQAVCFSECIWEALTLLSQSYSPFGLVFGKRFVFQQGGGPGLYMRGDLIRDHGANIPAQIEPFVVPFDPEAVLRRGVRLDWLQEREWRLPGNLQFEYADIQHVLVETLEDATWIVTQIGALNLPLSKVIPIDVYMNIRRAWDVG